MIPVKEQLTAKKGKVVWVASFPKSGNTWFRCFLSALIDGAVNINKLKTDRIFAARHLLDNTFDIDGRMLTEKEAKNRMPKVIRYYVQKRSKLLFCKIHDAYSFNAKGKPIIPEDVTHKAIYLIRNPLDVVASYANHNNCSIDQAIWMMNHKQGYLVKQANGLNISIQLPQLMYDWSGHVNSWHEQDKIELLTVRYEDMKKDSFAAFSKIMAALGLEVTEEAVRLAIDLTQFEKLKKAEQEKGFGEKGPNSPEFFRKGKTGGYKEELTPEQIEKICKAHGKTMQAFGYEIPVLT